MYRVDKVAGIDLGTTSSTINLLSLDDDRMLLGRHGDPADRAGHILPSAVAWHPEQNKLLIGREARARRGLNPDPILSIKRKMGMALTVDLAGKQVTPEHVSSLILRQLVDALRETLPRDHTAIDVRRAIITVPAHFKHPQSEATRRAGEMAGLEVVELLIEPIAAAIHFCWQRARQRKLAGETHVDKEETFLVFDMGGGTFDVAVIRRIPGTLSGDDFSTLAIKGESYLGGDDLDAVIAGDLFARLAVAPYHFQSLKPGDAENRVRYAKLLALAEQIKIRIGDSREVPLNTPDFFNDDRGRPVHLQTTYTKDEVETLIRPELERSRDFCEDALREAGLEIDQIDEILMIGGSSQVPMIRRMVGDWYCTGDRKARCASPTVHAPRICVGAGAALKGASLGRIYRSGTSTVPVILRDYGSCDLPQAVLRAELPAEADGQSLEGGTAVLRGRSGARVDGEILSAHRAIFEQVPLEGDQNNFFEVELAAAGGAPLAKAECFIRHNPHFVEPVGLNTSANVLSFAISLEVDDPRRNEVKRVTLAPKLTPLPRHDMRYEFRFPGGADTLLLPLYGDNQLIKQFHVPVGREIPAGATVELTASIDAKQKLSCRGRIVDGGPEETFDFDLAAPEPEAVPTREEFYRLKARAEAIFTQFGKHPAIGAQAFKVARLTGLIERAFERRDDAQVIQRMHDLEDVLEQLDPAKMRVEPPLEELNELASQSRAALSQLPASTTLNREELRTNIDHNQSAAQEAAEQLPPDQTTYSRCFQNIQTDHDAIFDEYRRLNPVTPEQSATQLIARANRSFPDAVRAATAPDDRQRLHNARSEITLAEQCLVDDPHAAADHARTALQLIGGIIEGQSEEPTTPGRVLPDTDGRRLEAGS